MNITLGIMFVLTVLLMVLAFSKDRALPVEGLREGARLFLQIVPTMVLAFVLAGMITVMLPRELMSHWLGEGSGLRGLLVGTVAGIMTPGGPFVQFPIIAGLLKAGAGVAPIVAYISSWSLVGINRFLVYEVPLLGWRLAVSRVAASILFPILIGMITRFIWVRMH